MIKEVYFTQMEVVGDKGYWILKITSMEDGNIQIISNQGHRWTQEEFEECIPMIRSAFDVLGKNIEREIAIDS